MVVFQGLGITSPDAEGPDLALVVILSHGSGKRKSELRIPAGADH
jgi:hypothetical protein